MAELNVHITPQDQATILVDLQGEVGVGHVDELERHFNKVCAQRPQLVVINCAGLNFIASIGMGTLVALNTSLRRLGGAVRLACVNDNVRNALKRARLDPVLEIHPDLESAQG